MSTTDEIASVFEAIDTETTAHDPVDQVSSEATAEAGDTPESETKTTETKADETTSDAEQSETGNPPAETTVTEADPSKTENSETETNTESKTDTETNTNTEAEVDWKSTLPPPPGDYNGPRPEIDPETGQITNMTPEQYETYITEKTKADLRKEGYANYVENQALNAAEQILPELKTNPAIRAMVENTRVASVLNGQEIDSYEAAKLVKQALGITSEKLAQAKAEGAQNSKVSIESQKRAAIETGSTPPANDEADRISDLQKRVKRGDDEAFIEILDIWEQQGKLK